ncbi:MAG: hypothetical protein FJ026_10935 [Chloroflexi bacterium]|nr:hypothetical protein [Chloroflexota bacterium]
MTTWVRIFSPALAMLLASAGLLGLLANGCHMWPEETEERSPTDMIETTTAAMPPLDTAAPPETETATFALG